MNDPEKTNIPRKQKLFDLHDDTSYLIPSSPVGELCIHRLKVAHLREIESLEKVKPFTAHSFCLVLTGLIVKKPDQTSLTDSEIQSLLSAEPPIASHLLKALKDTLHFVDENEKRLVQQAGAENIELKKKSVYRISGESDEDFLFRGWVQYINGFKDILRLKISPLSESHTILSKKLQDIMKPSLMANVFAENNLGETLRKMAEKDARPQPNLQSIKIPPNPIVATNKILSEVRADIADMRRLAEDTAQMQQSLNGVVTTLLAEFLKGAVDSKAATDTGLNIAKLSLAVACIALVATVSATILPLLFKHTDTVAIGAMTNLSNSNAQLMSALDRNSHAIGVKGAVFVNQSASQGSPTATQKALLHKKLKSKIGG